MQIKPYRQTENNTHMYHFYIEQKSYFKHSAQLREHYIMHSKGKEEGNFKVCICKSRKKEKSDIYHRCAAAFFFFLYGMSLFIYFFMFWVEIHRLIWSKSIVPADLQRPLLWWWTCWHLEAITIRDILQAAVLEFKQDLHHKKLSPRYKLSPASPTPPTQNGTIF